MCVLGKNEILNLIEKLKVVYPFGQNLLDVDGYILTVKDVTVLHYLEHKNLISNEIVFTPPDIVAHLTAKSRYGRLGLSFLNAAKVHSGFVGRLALELVNLSNDRQPITIKRGDPLMHMEFITREGKPSPYLGPYQFQYMSIEEVEIYKSILTETFPQLFDTETLNMMIRDRVGPPS